MKFNPGSLAALFVQLSIVPLQADTIPLMEIRRFNKAVAESGATYSLNVCGKLDSSNTITRSYDRHSYAFPTDVMLALENRSDTAVVNPRVSINGYRTPRNIDELLELILQGETDPQKKIYRIWDFVRSYRHHDYPLYEDDELHDPVKYLLIYGGGFCDDSGSVAASLFHRAGFAESTGGNNPFVRCLHGHMMSEVFFNGDYQFMDSDENAFYLDRNNRHPVGGDTVVKDHDLVHRELHYGPQFSSWETSQQAASLFGRDDERTTRIISGHVMNLTLRPGERIEYLWDYVAGYAASRSDVERRNWNNSRSEYRPLLLSHQKQSPFTIFENAVLNCLGGKLIVKVDPDRTARIGFPMALPYLITGATLAVTLETAGTCDWEVFIQVHDREAKIVGAGKSRARQIITCPLSDGLFLKENLPLYHYNLEIRICTDSAAAEVHDLAVSTDFLANPLLFPSLKCGMNKIVYEDDSAPDLRGVLIRHEWQENEMYEPLSPVEYPISPKNNETVTSSLVPFQWQEVEGATAYHLLVSTSPQCDLPYRTAYDVILPTNEYVVPFTGMFSPGRMYYWMIRAQDVNGVWSEWSEIWSFQWRGPCVPINLRTEERGREILLHWEADPDGEKPVRYKIYGSDIQGFSIHDATHTLAGLGEFGPNLLGETPETYYTVVTAHPEHINQNKVFYRVVAVDKNGVESGCSEALGLPHPLIVLQPPEEIFVGERIEYAVRSLRSLGDLQYRYESPNRGFWEAEIFTFRLQDAPLWLSISDRGVVSGVPSQAGSVSFKVVIESSSGQKAEQLLEWQVLPSR